MLKRELQHLKDRRTRVLRVELRRETLHAPRLLRALTNRINEIEVALGVASPKRPPSKRHEERALGAAGGEAPENYTSVSKRGPGPRPPTGPRPRLAKSKDSE
jgi:hypothetical protein